MLMSEVPIKGAPLEGVQRVPRNPSIENQKSPSILVSWKFCRKNHTAGVKTLLYSTIANKTHCPLQNKTNGTLVQEHG